MRKVFAFLMILFIISLSCLGEEPVKVVEVKAFKAGTYDQIEVYTSSRINPKVLKLDTHNQIALIFPNSTIEKPFNISAPSNKIKDIKVVQFSHDTVYVIIESFKELEYELANIIGKNKVILELGKEKEETRPEITAIKAISIEVKEEEIIEKVEIPESIPENFNLYILGKPFAASNKVTVKNKTIMVPVRDFFEAIDATVDFDPQKELLCAKVKYEWRLELKPDSKKALLKLVDQQNDKYIDKNIILPVDRP